MKKILTVILSLFIICGAANAVSNNVSGTGTATDNMTRSERLALTGLLKKLQTCQNAELSGANFTYKVSRNGSKCVYYERNNEASMTCNFPMDIAQKYGVNGVTLNNAILNNTISDFNPFVDSPLSRAFGENINFATKYCRQ